jgi:hypothetical protein
MTNLSFRKWLEMVGTGAIYDGTKPKEDWNWWGAPGAPAVSPRKGVEIKKKHKKHKKHGK